MAAQDACLGGALVRSCVEVGTELRDESESRFRSVLPNTAAAGTELRGALDRGDSGKPDEMDESVSPCRVGDGRENPVGVVVMVVVEVRA